MKRAFHLVLLCFFVLPATAQSTLHGHVRSNHNSAPLKDAYVIVLLEDSSAHTTFTDSLGNFTFYFPQTQTNFRFRLSMDVAPVAIISTTFAPVLASFPGEQLCTLNVVTLPPFIDERGGLPLEGIANQYYTGGQLYIHGRVKNGERDGEWLSFYENGMLWSRGTYVNGKRQGYAVTFYSSGKKSSEGYYKDDKMTGVWKFWDENGTLVEKDFGNQ
jgi:hypothetical protein